MIGGVEIQSFLWRFAGQVIHAIDPFKIGPDVARRKTALLQEIGSPFVLLASTDFDEEFKLEEYVNDIRSASELPIITHFPPVVGRGYPIVPNTNAVLLTAVLNSSETYFSCTNLNRRSVRETNFNHGPFVRRIYSAAITLGNDCKSARLVYARPVGYDTSHIKDYLNRISEEMVTVVYLFSRHAILRPELCTEIRRCLPRNCVMIVSGCISTRHDAERLLEAGAQFAVVGTAFEGKDWEIQMGRFLKVGVGVSKGIRQW
jgi:geranylgeranylglyceryl phosphate synthase family protein